MSYEFPKVGPTGSTVITCTQFVKSGVRGVYYSPPMHPYRVQDILDGDGNVIGERTLTDEEYAAALAHYTAASAEYRANGGRKFVRERPDIIECAVVCADDTAARALWNGKDWVWTHWGTK